MTGNDGRSSRTRKDESRSTLAGALSEADVARQAEMLANRVRKRFKHLRKRFEKDSVGAFRVYDWDIPEIRATVDWYEGHLVVAEYERRQTATVDDWLGRMARAAAQALEVPWERVHCKRRRTRPASGDRYEATPLGKPSLSVREGDLRFLVNLEDRLDTGLFPDHRITRRLVAEECEGRDVLNLFAYTGTFTCHAAAAGARRTTSVDASAAYLDWAAANLELNGLADARHRMAVADVDRFLRSDRELHDVAVLDPPSWSDRFGAGDLDVQRDHVDLVERTLARLRPGGVLWFSTNRQDFEPHLDAIRAQSVAETTDRTVPEDYRRRPHRSFRIVR